MPKYDVVVGFHPDDDKAVAPRYTHWVTEFCNLFRNRLEMMGLTPRPECWTFGDVAGYQVGSEANLYAIREARVLIAILSRLYGGPDPYYKQHWTDLAQAIGAEDFSTRLFHVYKLRPDPPPITEVRGYLFWRDERYPIELNSDSEEYAVRLNELAYDVSDVLKKLRTAFPPQSVFRASAPPSLLKERAELRTWLRGQGNLRLLPDSPLPLTSSREEYTRNVDTILSGCELSINLLAPGDGEVVPELDGQTPVAIEYYCARRLIGAGQMAGIAWAPPSTVGRKDAASFGVLGHLIGRPLQGFDDLVGDTSSTLHDRILSRLHQRVNPDLKVNKRLYVVSHPIDAPQVAGLITDLEQDGYRVEATLSSHEDNNWRSEYSEKLRNSHAAIMCGGNAPSNFLAYVQQCALEQVQLNLNFSLDRMALYAGPDPNDDKKQFVRWAPFKTKIEDYTGFRKSTVDPFLVSAFSQG